MLQNGLCNVDGDGKADARSFFYAHSDDTDHFAFGIEQRPAGVAGIDRRVGLDQLLQKSCTPLGGHLQRPIHRADDAASDGVLELQC